MPLIFVKLGKNVEKFKMVCLTVTDAFGMIMFSLKEKLVFLRYHIHVGVTAL